VLASEGNVQIQGEHLIHAPRDRVWRLLNDPDVLARITPGVTSLEPDGGDRYKATMMVALGPVKGSFKATMEIADKQAPEAMTLKVQARGPGGGLTAIGRIILVETEGGDATRVEWSGEPQLAGILATVGGRLLESMAAAQADQFFAQLEREATSM
jgi:uncharacterized protein